MPPQNKPQAKRDRFAATVPCVPTSIYPRPPSPSKVPLPPVKWLNQHQGTKKAETTSLQFLQQLLKDNKQEAN